jgi:hypothetical protein
MYLHMVAFVVKSFPLNPPKKWATGLQSGGLP